MSEDSKSPSSDPGPVISYPAARKITWNLIDMPTEPVIHGHNLWKNNSYESMIESLPSPENIIDIFIQEMKTKGHRPTIQIVQGLDAYIDLVSRGRPGIAGECYRILKTRSALKTDQFLYLSFLSFSRHMRKESVKIQTSNVPVPETKGTPVEEPSKSNLHYQFALKRLVLSVLRGTRKLDVAQGLWKMSLDLRNPNIVEGITSGEELRVDQIPDIIRLWGEIYDDFYEPSVLNLWIEEIRACLRRRFFLKNPNPDLTLSEDEVLALRRIVGSVVIGTMKIEEARIIWLDILSGTRLVSSVRETEFQYTGNNTLLYETWLRVVQPIKEKFPLVERRSDYEDLFRAWMRERKDKNPAGANEPVANQTLRNANSEDLLVLRNLVLRVIHENLDLDEASKWWGKIASGEWGPLDVIPLDKSHRSTKVDPFEVTRVWNRLEEQSKNQLDTNSELELW